MGTGTSPRARPASHAAHGGRASRALGLALAISVAGLVAACSSPAAPSISSPALVTFPAPAGAIVKIGAQGPGYDDGQQFYTYSSQLTPEAALLAYTGQLSTAGFMETARTGPWHVFRRLDTVISVRVDAAGPPTTIFVRVAVAPAQPSVSSTPGGDESTGSPPEVTATHGDGNGADASHGAGNGNGAGPGGNGDGVGAGNSGNAGAGKGNDNGANGNGNGADKQAGDGSGANGDDGHRGPSPEPTEALPAPPNGGEPGASPQD